MINKILLTAIALLTWQRQGRRSTEFLERIAMLAAGG
jgi:hypothetical protein